MNEWRSRAACRGEDIEDIDLIARIEGVRARWKIWFPQAEEDWPSGQGPPKHVRDALTLAKDICWNCCPVRLECAHEARRTRSWDGVWGGMSGRVLRAWIQEQGQE